MTVLTGVLVPAGLGLIFGFCVLLFVYLTYGQFTSLVNSFLCFLHIFCCLF